MDGWSPTDPVLIVAPDGFEQFFRTQHHRLVAIALPLTGDLERARDLAQEALRQTYRAWPVVSATEQPGAWTRRVLLNLATDVSRHRRRETAAAEFWSAVRALPAVQRSAVVLHYVDDLVGAGLASILEVTEDTATTTLRGARQALARNLKQPMTEPIDERARQDAQRVRRVAERGANTDQAWHQLSVSVGASSSTPGGQRVRRVLVAALVVAAALVAILLVGGVDRRGVAPVNTNPTTFALVTTSPLTDPPTSSSTSTPVTVAPGALGFVPACTDMADASSAPITAPEDPLLGVLGPLGAEPTLRITVPRLNISPVMQPVVPSVLSRRVPGGVLLIVTSGDFMTGQLFGQPITPPFDQSILAVVNDDGTIRWQRCLTDELGGLSAVATGDGAVATQAVVDVVTTIDDGSYKTDYRIIDLADGRDTGSVHDKAIAAGLGPNEVAENLMAANSHTLLFANATNGSIAASDRIVRVDLDTMAVTLLHVPRAAVGLPHAAPWLAITPAGDPAIFTGDFSGAPRKAIALMHRGRWLSEAAAGPALWAASYPIVVGYDFSVPNPVPSATDVHGKVVWTRPDLVGTGGEGIFLISSDGTAIGVMCTNGDPQCTDPELVALDVATGRDKWRMKGYVVVAFVADGLAMVHPPSTPGDTEPWQLIDLDTGSPIAADQRWGDPNAFASSRGSGCCLPVSHSEALGAMVVTQDLQTVSVWLPKALTRPAVSVSLP